MTWHCRERFHTFVGQALSKQLYTLTQSMNQNRQEEFKYRASYFHVYASTSSVKVLAAQRTSSNAPALRDLINAIGGVGINHTKLKNSPHQGWNTGGLYLLLYHNSAKKI